MQIRSMKHWLVCSFCRFGNRCRRELPTTAFLPSRSDVVRISTRLRLRNREHQSRERWLFLRELLQHWRKAALLTSRGSTRQGICMMIRYDLSLWYIIPRRKPGVLRPGFVGMRGQWSYMTTACEIMSTPPYPRIEHSTHLALEIICHD